HDGLAVLEPAAGVPRRGRGRGRHRVRELGGQHLRLRRPVSRRLDQGYDGEHEPCGVGHRRLHDHRQRARVPGAVAAPAQVTDTDDILFERRGGLAIAPLNRPRAINAMTLDMYRAFDAQLEAWGRDASVAAVLVRGAGERGFCAGGDVRAIHAARRRPPGPGDYKTDLYREEYRFIRKVHRLSKPYVALAHGITMGGGVGLSTNGRYRVATETTEVAMPEVFIGSIPDVGATRFFHMCPGRIGTYLALTGRRIGSADAIYCGLLTHYVRQDRLAALTEALAERDAETTLDRFAESPGPSKLAALRPAIDRCFGRPSVEAILDALHAE